MKNAKEIKFERSFTASRSIKQIKKNTDRLYTLLKVAQCQEWGYKNSLTRLVALFS